MAKRRVVRSSDVQIVRDGEIARCVAIIAGHHGDSRGQLVLQFGPKSHEYCAHPTLSAPPGNTVVVAARPPKFRSLICPHSPFADGLFSRSPHVVTVAVGPGGV